MKIETHIDKYSYGNTVFENKKKMTKLEDLTSLSMEMTESKFAPFARARVAAAWDIIIYNRKQ